MASNGTSGCAKTQRNAGILIPQCPPKDNLEINGEADYFFFAQATHEIYKATYDMTFDTTSASSDRSASNPRQTGNGELRITSDGSTRGTVVRGG